MSCSPNGVEEEGGGGGRDGGSWIERETEKQTEIERDERGKAAR